MKSAVRIFSPERDQKSPDPVARSSKYSGSLPVYAVALFAMSSPSCVLSSL